MKKTLIGIGTLAVLQILNCEALSLAVLLIAFALGIAWVFAKIDKDYGDVKW